MKKTARHQTISEIRQDVVSGDWVVIATGRAKRPHAFIREAEKRWYQPRKGCPFENPQKSGNDNPFLVLPPPLAKKDWFLQVFPNKFPAFSPSYVCPIPATYGPYTRLDGVGFHEVIVTHDHNRSIAEFSDKEAELLIRAYQERYLALMNEACVDYISIFHNHGKEAGASLYHPHSQLIAIPVIPGDVRDSLTGAEQYFKKNKHCVHCAMIDFELKAQERIIYENEEFFAVCPYTSRSAFEVVVSPKIHSANFELMSGGSRKLFARALRVSLHKLFKGLNNPDYNYFIHTAPADGKNNYRYYHWHVEILPKTAIWAGFEIATGIEISAIRPEDAAAFLRKQK